MSAKNSNSDDDKIPKLLRKLRSVKASDNFEMRLKRRISSADDQKKYNFVFAAFSIFSQYRLPAYAVSILTIFAVGVISYYAFFQTGIKPTGTLSALQNQVKVEQEIPVEFSADEKKESASNEATELEIKTKSRTRAIEIPRANVEDNRPGQENGQKSPSSKQLSVQLKQKADMSKTLLETLEMTYIDSISRVDTSKKNKP
jgi:preprotein translocase subunit SecF